MTLKINGNILTVDGGSLATAMRMAVEDGSITTLREFIQEQERQYSALEKLIMPLEGGKPV